MTQLPIVVASNRGPVTFVRDEQGRVQCRPGRGGLATALTGALQGSGGVWIASAITDEDRARAGRVAVPGAGYDVRYLAFSPGIYDRFYNDVSNRILWFVHHFLWDLPHSPSFDAGTREAWEAFRSVNGSFAEAMEGEAERSGGRAAFLVQDYHLSLVPAMLRVRSPGARIAHFSHTPFAGPGYLGVLPEDMREELLAGLLGADVLGFQAEVWAGNFLAACQRLRGARVDVRRRRIAWEGRDVLVRVYPITVDSDGLRSFAGSEEVVRRREEIERWRGGADLLVRVDRAELSKNIVRGFLAFEALLERRPDRRGRIRFLALLNPSRESLSEYRAYVEECTTTAERINARFGSDGWEPIRLSLGDDYARSVAAFGLYDALLVNPIFDGMNLVAKEGPLVNERDGVLILSRNAGAIAELGAFAVVIDPFDVAATASAIEAALDMPTAERRRRARSLRRAVLRRRPEEWVRAQLADLGADG